jgi:hypothetical protein
MKAVWRMLVVGALALGGGCSHTKTTDEGTEKPGKPEEGEAQKPAKRNAAEPGGRGSQLHPGDREAVPVATAPDALLAPGGDKKIRERLEAEGYLSADGKDSDAAMREGIRRFQRAKDLPVTGVPDHETVKRLGLDTNQVFRHGGVKD